MVKYTLHYFDLRGRGELLRLMFAFAGKKEGEDWCDKRYTPEEFAKAKESMPFRTLPVLELEDGRKISESLVIARFLAHELGLLGSTPEEILEADEIATVSRGMLDRIIRIHFEEKDKEKIAELRAAFRGSIMPAIMTNFEGRIKARNSKFFFGDHVTWADIVFYDATHHIFSAHQEIADRFSVACGLWKNVGSHPNLQAFIAANPKSLVD